VSEEKQIPAEEKKITPEEAAPLLKTEPSRPAADFIARFASRAESRRAESKQKSGQEAAAEPETAADDERRERRKKWLKIFLMVFIFLLILSLVGTAGYFYYKYKKASQTNPAENESQIYVNKISQFALLPDEEPTLATVADREKLKDQPFFASAQNGDKVLLFPQAKKAILYRPSENKLVEMMALSESQSGSLQNVQANQDSAVPPDTESQPAETESQPAEEKAETREKQEETARVAVYNGTDIKGLAQKIGDKTALISGVTISEKTNAKGSYKKTLVIDFSGQRQELAEKIAETLGGAVGTLPEGELQPDADILVIAGEEAAI